MSTRSDGQAQTSDEVFGEGMAKLGNGLQNWVLVNFRRAKIGELLLSLEIGRRLTVDADLSGADEAAVSEIGRLVPMYEDLASTSKIHLLQSVVSRVLVELVFDAYFAGLSSEMAGQLQQAETFLASCGKTVPLQIWVRLLTVTQHRPPSRSTTGDPSPSPSSKRMPTRKCRRKRQPSSIPSCPR